MAPSKGSLASAQHVQAEARDGWRRWLDANHATASGVWLVTWRRSSGRPRLDYDASIEEALCFGWIDGQAAGVDEQRSRLYFAPRRPGSHWSRLNKERFERMLQAGLVMPAGMAAVERARADGSWSFLDPIDRLEVPPDLAAALAARPPAAQHWERFPRSARRALLVWIASAKRPETRSRRVDETAAAAQRDERRR